LQEILYNRSHGKTASTDCVPIAYHRVLLSHYNEYGYLMMNVIRDAIATICSCR